MTEMGYKLTDAEVKAVTDKIKTLADKKKSVYDEDVRAIVEGQFTAFQKIKIVFEELPWKRCLRSPLPTDRTCDWPAA